MKPLIAVLAGTPQQFTHWVERERPAHILNHSRLTAEPSQAMPLGTASYKSIKDPEHALGLEFSDIIILGSFWYERGPVEAAQLYDAMRARVRLHAKPATG